MAQNEKKKSLNEQLSDCKKEIIANSKDAAWMKKQLSKLLSIKGQIDVEPVELIVPAKEVTDTIDFGACRISRTIRGYLFEAKGGMFTFVDNRMQGVIAMLNALFELHMQPRNELKEHVETAVQYVFQAPIFASLKDEMLFGIATEIIKAFNEAYKDEVENAKLREETAQDVEANIAMDNISQVAQDVIEKQI